MDSGTSRVTEQVELKKRKLLGFYIAAFVVLGLFAGGVLAWPRISAWRRERATTQLFINNLDHHINIDMKDENPGDALTYFYGLLNVGVMADWEGVPDYSKKKVTLQYKDVPIAVVLDAWCSQVGADWTVADIDCGKGDWPMFKLCLGSREHIRKLEEASPVAARMVRDYRNRLKKFRSAESAKASK
jgi:hypothetical protein